MLTDSKTEKFRSHTYSAFVNIKGELDIIIYDDLSNSSLTYRHNDFKRLLTTEENILEIDRSSKLVTILNGQILSNELIVNGKNPPSLNHQLKLSYLKLYSGSEVAKKIGKLSIENFKLNSLLSADIKQKNTKFSFNYHRFDLKSVSQQVLGDRYILYRNSLRQLANLCHGAQDWGPE